MNKIIYIMILSSILTFFGCKSKEKKFLEEHQVFFYNTNEYKEFEVGSKVKVKEALMIAYKFALEKNIHPMSQMFFVVDNQYVFTSYFHPKIPDASTHGIWVNATSGQAKYIKEEIWLKAYYSYKK